MVGAISGWKRKTTRVSFSSSSSAYASIRNVSAMRLMPPAGSMTYGVYFSFVCGSKYTRSVPDASEWALRS